MAGFVIRDWRLDPYDGDQAPLHIRRAGEEAFICIDGELEVFVDRLRERVAPGRFFVVPLGSPHTFASRSGAHVLAVMSQEIAELIDGLHADLSPDQLSSLRSRCRSSLA
jgi:quercetin dioxygenase-like cupin family protein